MICLTITEFADLIFLFSFPVLLAVSRQHQIPQHHLSSCNCMSGCIFFSYPLDFTINEMEIKEMLQNAIKRASVRSFALE